MSSLLSAEFSRLGFIGTGVMGKSMVKHCIQSGLFKTVTVYNRTTSKAESLLPLSDIVKLAKNPKELAQTSDVVVSIVGYPSDVRDTYLNPSTGVLAGLRKGGVVIDMTTSEPLLAQEIFEKGKEKGIYSLDAPVSGGDIGAREARLSIFVGGDQDIAEKMMPLFKIMGKSINYMGKSGSGQHSKMSNQIFIASKMIGVVEGLLYAQKAGLDVSQIIEACSAGAAGSWSLANYGPRIVKRELGPGFYVEHFIKDMEIAIKESERMGLTLPGLKLAKMLYDILKAHGGAKMGTHALIIALEKMNNIQMKEESKY